MDLRLAKREYVILAMLGLGGLPIVFAAKQAVVGFILLVIAAVAMVVFSPPASLVREKYYQRYLFTMFSFGVISFVAFRWFAQATTLVASVYLVAGLIYMYRTGSKLRQELLKRGD